MNRKISIDIAKALCIILVVIGHYHPDNSPEWYNVINRLIYSFHMPLFMFASGYIYMATLKPVSYSNFIWKKVKRLMIPYFSTSIIVITIKLLTQQKMLVENPVTSLSYLKISYSPEAGYFLWFIWALWGIFLIVPLIKTTKGRTILFTFSLLLGFIPIQWPDIFCIGQLIVMLKYFMLGVFLCEHSALVLKAKNISLFIPCLLFVLLFALKYFITSPLSHIVDFVLPFLGIYSVCMISIVIAGNLKKCTNYLLVVSSSSYTIYLFHTTFEGFAKSAIHKIPFLIDNNNFIGFSLGTIMVIACGILLPLLLHRYILERFSVLRFLFGLKNNKNKQVL